ncbi:hypothetical protein JCM16814_24240 [Desulfobaculum senezii]
MLSSLSPRTTPDTNRRLAILSSLAGALFCVLAALGLLDAACVTSGCAVFKGTAFLGLSLWWWGAACFLALAGLCVMRLFPAARLLAALAVCVDAFLLGWMALSATCTNCVLAGGLFALTFLCLFLGRMQKNAKALAIAVVWLVALSPNLVTIAQERIDPWILAGPETSPVHLYFSPSCPACRKALADLASNPGVAYIPVPKNGGDVIRTVLVARAVEAGTPLPQAVDDALAATEIPDDLSSWETLRLRLRLFFNTMQFKRFGSHNLPLMTTTGWYSSDAPKAQTKHQKMEQAQIAP